MTSVDPELAPLVRVARVAQIWRRSRLAVFLYLILFVPLGLGTPLVREKPAVFFGALGALALLGFLRWRACLGRSAPVDPTEAALWLRRYAVYTTLAGLTWGLFCAFVQYAYPGVFLQFACLLISAGIACFALGALAGEHHLTFAYLAGALLPTLGVLAWRADGESLVLLAMMVLFLVTVSHQILEANDWFVRSTVESLRHERSRQEAEAGARVKSEFLANMSHELRTPMNGVMGMLELLLQAGLNPEQASLARTSHRSAEALLEILNDILDFSKMSAGKLDFVRQDFLLRNVIEDVYELLGPRAAEKGIDLGYHISSSVPEWVCGDEGRLRQVLINLVGNAIKFSHAGPWPHGGSVLVEARLLEIAGSEVHLRFSVTDRGHGISPAVLPYLFEPFTQADSSTSRRYGGTGLGLAICRQLVTAMGGSIRAERPLAGGARFTFDIRLAAATASHIGAPSTSGCRALIIEAGPLSLATIGELLAVHGVTAELAPSLAAARDLLAGEPFQCVIAGTTPDLPAAAILEQVHDLFGGAPPPVHVLHHQGEALDGSTSRAFSLVRPVRASQIAELLVSATCLPRQTVPVPAASPTRLSGHVLVVEDNHVNQLLAERLLRALGLTVQVVSSGSAALDALKPGAFQLVLMDCQMPDLDGYEATRLLRRTPGLENLPVVAMTANAMKGDRELCLAAGMSDYMSKPIRADRLREVLSRYLPAAAERTK